VGTHTFTVRAEELDDTARAGLSPQLVAQAPSVGEYQARTPAADPGVHADPPGLTPVADDLGAHHPMVPASADPSPAQALTSRILGE
jgi:hypothetical protein